MANKEIHEFSAVSDLDDNSAFVAQIPDGTNFLTRSVLWSSVKTLLSAIFVQPGDPLTDLSSGSATDGQIPAADGAGGIVWEDESGSSLIPSAQTITTADVTGVAGYEYNCTIAGMTANRNLTLPVPSAAGEEIRINILDGDNTYRLIVKGVSTVTINGGSAATEWGRMFIAGGSVTFRSTSTTNWQVIDMVTKPYTVCQLTQSGLTAQVIPNSIWTQIADYHVIENNYGLYDASAKRITLPNANRQYTVDFRLSFYAGSWNAGSQVHIQLRSGSTIITSSVAISLGAAYTGVFLNTGMKQILSTSRLTDVSVFVYQNSGSGKTLITAGDNQVFIEGN